MEKLSDVMALVAKVVPSYLLYINQFLKLIIIFWSKERTYPRKKYLILIIKLFRIQLHTPVHLHIPMLELLCSKNIHFWVGYDLHEDPISDGIKEINKIYFFSL